MNKEIREQSIREFCKTTDISHLDCIAALLDYICMERILFIIFHPQEMDKYSGVLEELKEFYIKLDRPKNDNPFFIFDGITQIGANKMSADPEHMRRADLLKLLVDERIKQGKELMRNKTKSEKEYYQDTCKKLLHLCDTSFDDYTLMFHSAIFMFTATFVLGIKNDTPESEIRMILEKVYKQMTLDILGAIKLRIQLEKDHLTKPQS